VTQVTVVVGGQYGSEGKGAVAGFLSRKMTDRDVAVRVAGPNAGHTAYDAHGVEWKLRAVPVAAVTSDACQLHIAAGSEVDPFVLFSELNRLDRAGHRATDRLTIHPSATMLMGEHIEAESAAGLVNRIGSTGKGIGAARAARVMRQASTASEVDLPESLLSAPGPMDLDDVGWVVVEGTQGYGLGLHTENYPQVTSSDCRAIDFLGMAGISPWDLDVGPFEVIVVIRTHPIRVAGNSGPLKDETSWEHLNLPEERTTVTNKVRRVGQWDSRLVDQAIRANGGGGWNDTVKLAVTMLDQKFPEVKNLADSDLWSSEARSWIQDVQDEFETDVAYVGSGPDAMGEVRL
jgi:adenylosuccinate synthase